MQNFYEFTYWIDWPSLLLQKKELSLISCLRSILSQSFESSCPFGFCKWVFFKKKTWFFLECRCLFFQKKGFCVSVSSLIFSQHPPRCVGKKMPLPWGCFTDFKGLYQLRSSPVLRLQPPHLLPEIWKVAWQPINVHWEARDSEVFGRQM